MIFGFENTIISLIILLFSVIVLNKQSGGKFLFLQGWYGVLLLFWGIMFLLNTSIVIINLWFWVLSLMGVLTGVSVSVLQKINARD